MEELTPKIVETIRGAAKELTGAKRREFEAQVSLDYLGGDPQLTETVFGWSRHTVAKGLKERRTGQIIPDAPRTYKPKTEDAQPRLAQDIIDLVEPDSQTDPKFQGLFKYTRLTAKAVREMLIEHKGYTSEELPHQDTIGQMLDRLGYKMRRVQKAKPRKKIKATSSVGITDQMISSELLCDGDGSATWPSRFTYLTRKTAIRPTMRMKNAMAIQVMMANTESTFSAFVVAGSPNQKPASGN